MTSTTLPRSEIAGLSAIKTGKGPPVVLLHGVGLQAEANAAQIQALCEDYLVIAPDMAGHGDSPRPNAPMELIDYVDAIQNLLDVLDAPAIVIGHSMGAMIALELADRAPQQVCGVVALNAVFERSHEASRAVKARADSLDGITLPDPTQTLTRWFGVDLTPERAACETWLRAVDPLGYKLAYMAFAQSNGPSRPALKALTCPALFMTGALEPNSTPEMSHAMAALASQGRGLILKGAAHMMPMTHAAQVNAATLNFAKELAP